MSMLVRVFVLLAVLIAAAIPASARPRLLTVPWQEREGEWAGTWSPNDPNAGDGQYRAVWRKGAQTVSAGLIISLGPFSLSGMDVHVSRQTDRGGHCDYTGRLSLDPRAGNVPRLWRANGTYLCNGSGILPWSASIDIGPDPLQGDGETTSIGIGPPRDSRLDKVWHEQEGVWFGTWTPRNPGQFDGAYEALWHRRGERASAFLQISITADATGVPVAHVQRTEGRGSCAYTGFFNGARTVRGTYTCTWVRGQLVWSATIDP